MKRFFSLTSFALGAILLCTAPALANTMAQNLPSPSNPSKKTVATAPAPAPQKLYPIHDDASWAAGTKVFDVLPSNQANLEFSIVLPKDWEADVVTESTTQGLSQKILGDVAHFKSPMIGTSRAAITVQVLYLEHEISARNWLRNFILTNGFAPQGDVMENGNNEASAYFISNNEGRGLYSYIGVHISGNVIMLSRFDVPLQLKDFTAYVQKKTIDSFRMSYQKDAPAEEQKSLSLADAIKLEYPASWDLTSTDIKNLNRLNARLSNKDQTGTVQGVINISAVRRGHSTTLASEIDTVRKYFTVNLNYNVVKMVSSDKSPAYGRFIFNRDEVYDIQNRTKNQNPQELHLIVLGDREWYIFIYMITPKEGDNLYTWARNTRTLQELIQSIK